MKTHYVLVQNNIVLASLGSYQGFTGALEHIANKMAVPFFHCLPANEAKMIHVTNALEKTQRHVFVTHIIFTSLKGWLWQWNTLLHTCEQKEISLKLFSIETFLVSGLTRTIWEPVTWKSKGHRKAETLIRAAVYLHPWAQLTTARTDQPSGWRHLLRQSSRSAYRAHHTHTHLALVFPAPMISVSCLENKREISWQELTEVKPRLCPATISICWVNWTFSSFISFFGPLSNFTSAEKDSAAFLHTLRKSREQFSLGPLLWAPATIGRDGNVMSALTDVFTAFFLEMTDDTPTLTWPKSPISAQSSLRLRPSSTLIFLSLCCVRVLCRITEYFKKTQGFSVAQL